MAKYGGWGDWYWWCQSIISKLSVSLLVWDIQKVGLWVLTLAVMEFFPYWLSASSLTYHKKKILYCLLCILHRVNIYFYCNPILVYLGISSSELDGPFSEYGIMLFKGYFLGRAVMLILSVFHGKMKKTLSSQSLYID